jgi:hypothetical protein
MNELKNFLYEYMKRGRLKEAMSFFWNIIIMFQAIPTTNHSKDKAKT